MNNFERLIKLGLALFCCFVCANVHAFPVDSLSIFKEEEAVWDCNYLEEYLDQVEHKGLHTNSTVVASIEYAVESNLIEDCSVKLEYYNFLGLIKYIHNDLIESRACLAKVDSIIREDNLNLPQVKVKNKIYYGLGYNLQEDYAIAKHYFQAALTESRLSNDISYEADALLNLGLVSFETRDFSVSERFLLEAEVIAQSIDNYEVSGFIAQNLARLYVETEDYQRAKLYIDRTEEIWASRSTHAGLYYLETIKASYYEKINDVDNSIKALKNALRFGDKSDIGILKGNICSSLGDLYYQEATIDSAITYYQMALNHSKNLETNVLQNIYENLHAIYATDHHHYEDESEALFRSLMDNLEDFNIQQKQETQVAYGNQLKLEREQSETKRLVLKQQLQRTYLIFLVMGLLSLLLFIGYLIYQSRLKRSLLDTIQQQNTDLEDKNQELENFVSIVSHDLKGPTKTIYSFAKLLEEKSELSSSQNAKKYLGFIQKGATNMHNLVEDLLQFSKVGKQGLAFSYCNPKKLIQETMLELHAVIEDSNAVITIADSIPSQIIADRIKLKLVFQNLLANGIKFIEPGVLPKVKFDYRTTGTSHVFLVSDNGVGIDDAHKKKIFRKFQRYHTDYDGTGIGLSTCQKIIELHDGKIKAIDNNPTGTTFLFDISKNIEIG